MKTNRFDNTYIMEVFIMTCADRIRRIRMMERMERMYDSGSDRVIKTEDGTMKYLDSNGDVMIEAKMIKREA